MSEKWYRLGCDIGGTFTDFVLIDERTGELVIHKCLTTPHDPSEAVEAGIRALAARVPGLIGSLGDIIHGTTLVINAIIERKGANTALITTKGFRDILELGREKRYDTYNVFAEYPKPLIPRASRYEVDERIAADGRVLKRLDRSEVLSVVDNIRASGANSLAVCLINSFENPAHEIVIKEIIEAELPELPVSISYDVLPQIREYERTSTTAANAYVKPLTARYLTRLEERLKALGFGGKLYIMLSSGGITSVQTAREAPVRIIESGPTAAVISAEHYAKQLAIAEMFAFDMGGTTAKSCLIQGGRAGKVSTFEVGRVDRFKKGSGLPIQVPVVDLMEIGAGGGSIARISKLGLLQVGPDSASADPGPACYGRGGEDPTVTDANLVLGYLDPNYFLGGQMALDLARAERAILGKVAEPLNLTLTQAAWGIHDVINETMAAAAKTHIAEKGGSPRAVTIAAFGGAGPVHAMGLAKKLKARRVIIPPAAGVGSALGFFAAPISYEVVRTRKTMLRDADFAELEQLFRELSDMGAGIVGREGGDSLLYQRSIDMRLAGQGCECTVAMPSTDLSLLSHEDMRAMFDDVYQNLFGRTYPEIPLELVTFNVVVALSPRPLPATKIDNDDHAGETALKGERPAYSPLAGNFISHKVYDRYRLSPGLRIPGPAIIEENESTTIVGEGGQVEVGSNGFLFIQIEEAR